MGRQGKSGALPRGSDGGYHAGVGPSDFEEEEFWRSVARCGARALVIGRRAVIMLGAPVVTGDFDLWIHIDDSAALNAAVEHLGLYPNWTPDEARRRGRYVLENDMRVDVLVARGVPTIDGRQVLFDELWPRRQFLQPVPGVDIALPSTPDLILTKMFAARPKDATDVAFLRVLLEKRP